jgi:putative pyruvate formate lyase activating enzyme
MLHHFEEPCISGGEGGVGSGAIFFSGCALRCVFCQNREISRGAVGEVFSVRRLADEMLALQERGAYNINLVTPTHFTLGITEALDLIKRELSIPVIWNTSGYETAETVRALSGYVDIFLTDFKYFSSDISSRYSSAPDYSDFAGPALSEMVKITGAPEFDGEFLKRGTVVRHLVLPGFYRDSIDVLKTVAERAGAENVILSLMAQYTPEFLEDGYPEIDRRITTFEYNKVLACATELGFDGYMQSRESASARYTPDF